MEDRLSAGSASHDVRQPSVPYREDREGDREDLFSSSWFSSSRHSGVRGRPAGCHDRRSGEGGLPGDARPAVSRTSPGRIRETAARAGRAPAPAWMLPPFPRIPLSSAPHPPFLIPPSFPGGRGSGPQALLGPSPSFCPALSCDLLNRPQLRPSPAGAGAPGGHRPPFCAAAMRRAAAGGARPGRPRTSPPPPAPLRRADPSAARHAFLRYPPREGGPACARHSSPAGCISQGSGKGEGCGGRGKIPSPVPPGTWGRGDFGSREGQTGEFPLRCRPARCRPAAWGFDIRGLRRRTPDRRRPPAPLPAAGARSAVGRRRAGGNGVPQARRPLRRSRYVPQTARPGPQGQVRPLTAPRITG